MTKNSINDIEKLLQPYVTLVSRYGADGNSLERVEDILSYLGKPQEKLKVIHVAGTSGKTSTAYYCAYLLANSGYKVGLSVSPHVYSLTERVQIIKRKFTEDNFISELILFLKEIDEIEIKPSYFEIFTAFSMWVFDRQVVDYVVLETGMGGLLDASNIAKREDKICVITDIGFDHTKVLGNTLSKIAYQKAGIIHENNKVFMYEQSLEVMSPVRSRVKNSNAALNIVKETPYTHKIATQSQLSKYQHRNFYLAKQVYEYCLEIDSKNKKENFDTKQVKIPARIEILKLANSSTLVLDGAHNAQKMAAFVESFSFKYPNEKASVMIALKNEKDYEKILDVLIPIANQIVVTNFVTSKNLPSKSVNPKKIGKYIEDKSSVSVKVITNPIKAANYLLNGKSNLKIITGSFYLISQVRGTVISSL